MIGNLEFAVGCVTWLGSVVKATVGQGAAEALVEEQEQESHLNAFGGQAVGVVGAITLEQSVSFEFAQIVAELVQTVGVGRKPKGGEDGLVDLFCGPTANRIAAMKQNLE